MADIRGRIVRLIASNQVASDRVERTERLIEAMVGEYRETYAQARRVALMALGPSAGVNLRIRNAIEQVAAHDGAPVLKKEAQEILARHPETPD